MNDLNKVILQIAGGDMKEPTLEEKLQKEYDEEVKWLIEKYEADPEITVEAIYVTLDNLSGDEVSVFHSLLGSGAYSEGCNRLLIILKGWREKYIRECAESKARGE